MSFIIAFLVALTITYGAILIIRAIPAMKLALKIKKVKREIKELSRIWKSVEREFVKNEQFREDMLSDPGKMSVFLDTVDHENGTDFCKGLTSDQLTGLFVANPDVMERRMEEYLCYRRTAKI